MSNSQHNIEQILLLQNTSLAEQLDAAAAAGESWEQTRTRLTGFGVAISQPTVGQLIARHKAQK